jgi:hypothetical protein
MQHYNKKKLWKLNTIFASFLVIFIFLLFNYLITLSQVRSLYSIVAPYWISVWIVFTIGNFGTESILLHMLTNNHLNITLKTILFLYIIYSCDLHFFLMTEFLLLECDSRKSVIVNVDNEWCDVLQTSEYIIVSGARRQENRWDPKENEQVVPEDKNTSKRLYDDAMFKLEHGYADKKQAGAVQPALAKLTAKRHKLWQDDYTANCLLRQQFRVSDFCTSLCSGISSESKAVQLHTMEALGKRGSIIPTHSWPQH